MSQKSFGSRLGKAKKLHTITTNFSDYAAPLETASVNTLANTIASIETLQKELDKAKSNYTSKTDIRKKVFYDNANSLEKCLSPIGTFIKVLKGSKSTEYTQVSGFISKIRGGVKKTSSSVSASNTNSISNVERSYASRLSNFKSIIVILTELGESYTPSNAFISLEALQELAITAENCTTEVDVSLSTYTTLVSNRLALFSDLKLQCQNIKDSIKMQYGVGSNQYAQVKKLDI